MSSVSRKLTELRRFLCVNKRKKISLSQSLQISISRSIFEILVQILAYVLVNKWSATEYAVGGRVNKIILQLGRTG